MAAGSVHGLFLDNAVVPVGTRAVREVHDPADGSVVGRVASATRDDARAALDSAAIAQPAWEAIGAAARAKVHRLEAEGRRGRRDELAGLIAPEMGRVR